MAGVKSVTLKLLGDSTGAETALEKVDVKADELSEKHPDLKIGIDSAAAEAKLALLKKEIDDVSKESESSRLSSLGQALNGLTLGLSGGVGEMSMFQKAMLGLNVATGIGEPLVAGLTVAVGGLAAGLLSAGAGLGVFGVVAKTAFTDASTAATAAQTAQATYTSAVQSANLTYAQSMKTATTATAAQAAATARNNAIQSAALAKTQALTQAYAGMSPSMVTLSKQITSAESSWTSFVNANTAGVSRILSQGLGLLPNVLSMLQPFLAPTEKALSGLVKDLGDAIAPAQKFSKATQEVAAHMGGMVKPAQEGSVRSFFQLLSQNAGQSITKIGVALGHVGTGIMGILRAFMPMAQTMLSGLDKITAKFAAWGSTLSGHSGFQSMMTMFHQETPLVIGDLTKLVSIVKSVVGAMAGMTTFSNSTSLFKLAAPILSLVAALAKAHPGLIELILYGKLAYDTFGKLKPVFSGVSEGVKAFSQLSAGFKDADAAASDATGIWGTFGGKLSTAVEAVKNWGIWSKVASAATKVWTGVQAAFDAVMDANPVVLIVAGIVALVAIIVVLVVKVKAFRDFWIDVWNDVRAIVSGVWDWIKGHWPLLLEILTGPIGIAVVQILKHWDTIKNAAMDAWQFIVKLVPEAWHEITSAIKAGAQLAEGIFRDWLDIQIDIARDIYRYTVDYVVDMYHDVVNTVRTLVSDVIHFFSGLPGEMLNIGRNIIDGLVHGIEDGVGDLLSMVRSVASDVTSAFKGVLGIFSPSKVFYGHGQSIVQGLVNGIRDGMGMVHSQVNQLASATTLGGHGAYGAVAGGGALQVEWIGGQSDGEFMTWLKKNIRIRGGDVTVLGR